MADSANQAASLDVVIAAPGATEARAQATGALDAIAASATKNAAAMDASSAASTRNADAYQTYAARVMAEQQKLIAQMDQTQQWERNGANAGKAYLDGLDRQFQSDMAHIREESARGFLTPADAHTAGIEAAQAYNQGILSSLDQLGRNGFNAGNSAAYTQLAGSLKTVGESADVGNVGLGRIRMGLISLAAQTTGTIPVLDRMGAAFLQMGIGQAEIIGVLAAIAAIAGAYEFFTADARRAQEQQDKLTDALMKWYDAKERGAAGEREEQVQAENEALKQQAAQLKDLTASLKTLQNTYDAKTGLRDESGILQTQGQIDALTSLMQKEHAEIAAANADIVKSDNDAFMKQQADMAAMLEARIQFNTKDAAARAAAIALLKQDQALYAQYLTQPLVGPDGGPSVAASNAGALASQIDQLEKALGITQRTAKSDAELADAIIKQFNALQKANEAQDTASRLAQQQLAIDQSSGIMKQLLTNYYSALNAEIQVMASDALPAEKDAHIAAIEATRQHADALAVMKSEIAGVEAAGKTAHDTVMKQLHEETTQIKANMAVSEELARVERDLSREIGQDFANTIEQLSNGPLTWKSFFQETTQLSQRMAQQVGSAMDSIGRDIDKARTDGASQQYIDQLQAESDHLAQILKDVQKVQAAVTGASVGYNIGKSSDGDYGAGAIGGGVSGALSGFAIAGPAGAAIGGLAGVVGGLLGAGDAARQAAAQLKLLQDQLEADISAIQAQVGVGSSVDAAIAEARGQFDKLRQEAQAAASNTDKIHQSFGLPDGKLGDNLAQINALEAQRIQQLKDEDAAARLAFDQTQQEAILRTQGHVQEADALALQIQQTKAMADAVQQFGANSAEVTVLAQAQAAAMAALAAQQAQANREANEDLEVRRIAATQGQTAADAYKHQLDEQREVEAALAAGRSAEYIEQLKQVQALEDQAAATAAAAAAAESAKQMMEDLTARYLTAIGDVNGAATAQLLAQQRRETDTAIANHATPESLAMLSLTQLMERAALVAQQQAATQTKLLQAQLTQQQSALQTAQATLQATKQAAESLSTYRDSLSIGNLSPLSPADQLAAAKAQLDATYKAAVGGDTTAAGNFSAQANTVLELQKQFSASSPAYAAEFNSVQQMASTLADQYTHQASLQQQTVDALQQQIALLQQQLDALQDANAIAKAVRDAAVADIQAQVQQQATATGSLLDSLAAVRDATTGVANTITSGEYQTVLANQNAVALASQNEVDAINSGASQAQVAHLEQIRQLDLQKQAADDASAAQIAALGKQLGYDSPAVLALVEQQRITDTGFNNQLIALGALPVAISDAMMQILPNDTHGQFQWPSSILGPSEPPGPPPDYTGGYPGGYSSGSSGGSSAGAGHGIAAFDIDLGATVGRALTAANAPVTAASGDTIKRLEVMIDKLSEQNDLLKAIIRQQGDGFSQTVDALETIDSDLRNSANESRRARLRTA